MKATLLYALALAGVLAVGALQVSPAGNTDSGFTLARKTPEPPAHPEYEGSDPYDRKLITA